MRSATGKRRLSGFLSADAEKPLTLEQTDLAVAGNRFTVALGALVLWSAKPGYVDDQGQTLSKRIN